MWEGGILNGKTSRSVVHIQKSNQFSAVLCVEEQILSDKPGQRYMAHGIS